MKVRIAFAVDPATGQVDQQRVGTVEDHPDAEAKRLIKEGIAARATDADVEDYEARLAYQRGVAEAERASADADKAAAEEANETAAVGAEKADAVEPVTTEPAASTKSRRSAAQPTATGDPADLDSE